MALHNDVGNKGEEVALKYLTDKGFTVLETNWHFGKEEVDIIALNTEYLIIVEVKTRTSRIFGEPYEFVNKNKQRLLIKAAQAYAERFQIQQEVRFDIISILFQRDKAEVTHLESAFYPVL
ncbi:MAG TPA: YraN family protein [Lentimicrobium sp.]|jgi:putative endonuclease|nr:YraN family protein [Lentimicrobium sp.]